MAKLKDFHYAQIVHDTLCAKTDCMEKDGKICMCRYIVCIDDDVTSAIYASKISALHKKNLRLYSRNFMCRRKRTDEQMDT